MLGISEEMVREAGGREAAAPPLALWRTVGGPRERRGFIQNYSRVVFFCLSSFFPPQVSAGFDEAHGWFQRETAQIEYLTHMVTSPVNQLHFPQLL